MRKGRSLVSVLATTALTLGLITAVAAPANAALPVGPTSSQTTGDRPGSTELGFAVSDRVTASVDVGTGNLRVSTSSLSLVGVNGQVEIGRTYNSLRATLGSTSTSAANRWTLSVGGVGWLAAGASGAVIYTDGSGATWQFTPSTSTPGAFVSPAGAKADLALSSGNYTLTERESRQVATFNADGHPISITDRNGNTTTISYSSPGIPSAVVSSAGPIAARTAMLDYPGPYGGQLTATQTSGASSRQVTWTKDASSNLTSMVDAMGRSTTFAYSGQLLTSITGPTGATISFEYQATTNRVLRVSQSNTSPGSPGTSDTRLAYPSTTQTLLARPNTNQRLPASARSRSSAGWTQPLARTEAPAVARWSLLPRLATAAGRRPYMAASPRPTACATIRLAGSVANCTPASISPPGAAHRSMPPPTAS